VAAGDCGLLKAGGLQEPGWLGGWRCGWETGFGGGGEGLGVLPGVDEGVDLFAAFGPELDLEVVTDLDVGEEVGAVFGEPALAVEGLQHGVGVAEILAAAVVGGDGVEELAGFDLLAFGELFVGGEAVDGVGEGVGLGVGGGHLVGELELEAGEIEAAGAELHGVEGVGFLELAEGGVGGAGLGDELDGALGVETAFVDLRAHLGGEGLTGGRPGVDPEGGVVGGDGVLGEGEFGLGLFEFAGGVAEEEAGEGVAVGRGGGEAGLPACGGTEDDAEPILVEEAFAIVVPDGVEDAGGAEALAGFDEAGDVVEGIVAERVDEAPVGVAGGDPGFNAGLFEGEDVVVVAVFVPVDPGDRDHVFGEMGDGGGVAGGDVAPEEDAAIEGSEGGVDLGEEVGVDGAEAALGDIFFRSAGAEFEGFIGADVEEGAGEVLGDLREPGGDEGLGAGLAGGEDVAVWGFGEGGVLFVLEDVVEVAEGFLLGDDGDVVLGGEGGELLGFGAGEGAAGRRAEGIVGVLEGVFEVGGVEVGLVGGEDLDLVLLEGEGGEGSTGDVVREAAVLHGGPVADGGGPERWALRAGFEELLEGLGGVEEAGGGVGDEEGLVGTGDEDVAFVVLLVGDVELGFGEDMGCLGRGGAEEGDDEVRQAGVRWGEDALGGEGGGEVAGGEEVGGVLIVERGDGGGEDRELRAGVELAGGGDEGLGGR